MAASGLSGNQFRTYYRKEAAVYVSCHGGNKYGTHFCWPFRYQAKRLVKIPVLWPWDADLFRAWRWDDDRTYKFVTSRTEAVRTLGR